MCMTLTEQLRQYLSECGSNQKELAKAADCPPSSLTYFLGGGGMTLALADKLCKALNLELMQTERPELPAGRSKGRPRKV